MLNLKQQLKTFQAVKAMGELAIASEYTMVVDDYPELRFAFKTFPIPVINPEDTIEVPMLGGQIGGTPQLAKTYFKGTFALLETTDGMMRKWIEQMAAERTHSNRPKFNFTLYYGTPEDHSQSYRCYDGTFFGAEPVEADTENRSQLAIIQGQIAYYYFGESK